MEGLGAKFVPLTDLLKKDRIEDAIDRSLDILDDIPSNLIEAKKVESLYFTILNLSGNLESINQSKQNGIVSEESYLLSRNKIRYSILSLVAEVEVIEEKLIKETKNNNIVNFQKFRNSAKEWKKYKNQRFDFTVCYNPTSAENTELLINQLRSIGFEVVSILDIEKVSLDEKLIDNLDYLLDNSQSIIIVDPSTCIKDKQIKTCMSHFEEVKRNNIGADRIIYSFDQKKTDQAGLDYGINPSGITFVNTIDELLFDYLETAEKIVARKKEHNPTGKLNYTYQDKDQKLLVCPKCNSDVIDPGMKLSQLLLTSFILSLFIVYLQYDNYDWLSLFGLFVISLIAGTFGIMFIMILAELITNINILKETPICDNCGHKLKAREDKVSQGLVVVKGPNTKLEPKISNAKKHLKDGDIIKAIEELTIFFRLKNEELYVERVQEIYDRCQDLRNDRIKQITSDEEYNLRRSGLVLDIQSLLEDFKKYKDLVKQKSETVEQDPGLEKVYKILLNCKCEKYYPELVKAGYTYRNIGTITKSDMEKIGIPPGDAATIAMEVLSEKQLEYPKYLSASLVSAIVALGFYFNLKTKFYSLNNIMYSGFDYLNNLNLSFTFSEWLLLIIPAADIMISAGFGLLSLAIFIILINHKAYLDGNPAINFVMIIAGAAILLIAIAFYSSMLAIIAIFINDLANGEFASENSILQIVFSKYRFGFWINVTLLAIGFSALYWIRNKKDLFG